MRGGLEREGVLRDVGSTAKASFLCTNFVYAMQSKRVKHQSHKYVSHTLYIHV